MTLKKTLNHAAGKVNSVGNIVCTVQPKAHAACPDLFTDSDRSYVISPKLA